jgi:hypothetical protein
MAYIRMSVVEVAREESGASGDDFARDRRKCALRADGAVMRAQ